MTTRFRPPGQVRPGMDPDVLMMICTAGHVDHGKTELVKLLTGCNTDRLKEEQERGLTIELGFAPCFLGGNLCVGIVDVPGHEKLVRTMVSGVSGIDLAVLVVAADDGVMPQTIEHVQILQLLGVSRGLVALTKIDLVSPEQLSQRIREVGEFLRGTFMEGATICPVSSRTLEGYDAFYEAVVRETTGAVKVRAAGLFRMPIERSFTRKGFGAIVTGIPLSGTVRVGDEVELTPGGVRGRVRGIQRFLRDANEGGAGQCLALNVPELKHNDALRGCLLTAPGLVQPSRIFHVRVSSIPGLATPLKNAQEIRFHAGTAEEHGRIYLLEETGPKAGTNEVEGGATRRRDGIGAAAVEQPGSGSSVLATIVLAEPVAASAGDRFIIRRMSPPATVGGGHVLAVCHAARRPIKKRALEQLRQLEAALGGRELTDPAAAPGRLEYLLASDYPLGGRIPELARALQLPVDAVRAAATALAGEDRVRILEKEYCIHAQSYAELLEQTGARLRKLAGERKALSTDMSSLRGGRDWPEPVWDRMVADLQIDRVMVARGNRVILTEAVEGLPEADRDLMDRIRDLYARTGFQSPRPDEAAERLGADPAATKRLLEYLYASGELIRLSANVVLSRETFREAEQLVVGIIQDEGVLDSADFKHRIGSSRKYALAILDFLDARRVTLRMGNNRKLAPEYEKNLL